MKKQFKKEKSKLDLLMPFFYMVTMSFVELESKRYKSLKKRNIMDKKLFLDTNIVIDIRWSKKITPKQKETLWKS